LAELPGIGAWSAGVVLLRGLGRLDVFPPGDVGAQRGLRAVMHLGPGAALGRIIERFGNHRGYLYFCALGGGLLAKGLIRAAPPWS
jgi:DNA-3-methyladenine glycosylase II